MLLRSYSENRNNKFQIQGGLCPFLNLSGGGECPGAPPLYPPLPGREKERKRSEEAERKVGEPGREKERRRSEEAARKVGEPGKSRRKEKEARKLKGR